jgi:hypothetical protein
LLVNFDTIVGDTSGGALFHGVTISGTTVNGTTGPVAKSLILAPGQSMTFTGAYSNVDVFFNRAATGGPLTFQYNGAAAYKTVTTTGAVTSDVYSGPSPTGQTASGTYTITNTGSVSVEITGLVRQGAVVGGSPPRLNVFRIAHGGYQLQSYGAAAHASVARMSTAFGGTAANAFHIIALETNDAQGGTYTSVKAEVGDFLIAATGAGFTTANMMGVGFWRWSSYPGGHSYEAAHAGLRDGYAAATPPIPVIPLDGYDFIAEGLSGADGHPVDAGEYTMFGVIAENLAGIR